MAETVPPPNAGAESCSEAPARGGERLLEEPSRAPTGSADREGEAGPPLASPAGQSEPGSPVAAPFFLLYPGDGGAGFAARPPPQQQQRSWRTPPSPGSPLPFLLLSYPSGGGGGGGKHREWRREGGHSAGKGPGGLPRSGRRTVYLRVSPGRGLPPGFPSPPGLGGSSSPAAHVLAGSQPRVPGWVPSPEGPRRGRRPETRQPRWPAFCELPALGPRSRCGCCAAAAAARAASVVPLKFLRAFTPHRKYQSCVQGME